MIKITKAKITDAKDVRNLESQVWGEEVVSKYDEPMFIRFGWCFVAKSADKIVGAICSYLTRDNEVFVCDWVVDDSYRQQNIGLRLYKKLIKEIKDRNIITFIDPKNEPSLAAHKKLGFKSLGMVKNTYDLHRGLDAGSQILLRLKAK